MDSVSSASVHQDGVFRQTATSKGPSNTKRPAREQETVGERVQWEEAAIKLDTVGGIDPVATRGRERSMKRKATLKPLVLEECQLANFSCHPQPSPTPRMSSHANNMQQAFSGLSIDAPTSSENEMPKPADNCLSRASTEPPLALLELPNELVDEIAAYINRRSDLLHLSKTCKQLYDRVVPKLYRGIILKIGEGIADSRTKHFLGPQNIGLQRLHKLTLTATRPAVASAHSDHHLRLLANGLPPHTLQTMHADLKLVDERGILRSFHDKQPKLQTCTTGPLDFQGLQPHRRGLSSAKPWE